jgi:hypothetical protein
VFQLGAARFGITLCAEGEVDFPWDDAVAGGASVLFNRSVPGLTALVSPGREEARLAAFRPGSLVVEVAADVTVHPIREAVRCLVLDHAGRALLVRYADDGVDGTPRDLPDLLARIARGDLPGPDQDLGI